MCKLKNAGFIKQALHLILLQTITTTVTSYAYIKCIIQSEIQYKRQFWTEQMLDSTSINLHLYLAKVNTIIILSVL
jgi:hypothetical protein